MNNITIKQLKNILIKASEKKQIIDLKLDDEELIDLEPLLIESDLILRCKTTTIYLNRIKRIRIYSKNDKLIYDAEVTQDIEKISRKELEHELIFLRNVVKKQKIEIDRLIHNKPYKTVKNERGAGRKPFSDFEIVKRIFDYYINGYSTNKISDILKKEMGGNWSKASIRVILLNPFYIDKCIDKATFDKVQEIMKNKPKGRGKKE